MLKIDQIKAILDTRGKYFSDAEKPVIGFTASSADLLHPGFLKVLAEAKRECDWLVVGLQTNPTNDRPDKNVPVQSSAERYLQLYSTAYVDQIIPFDTEADLLLLLQLIEPDVRFVGEEYKGTNHTGHDLPGIRIIYNKRNHPLSTSELRQRVMDSELKLIRSNLDA